MYNLTEVACDHRFTKNPEISYLIVKYSFYTKSNVFTQVLLITGAPAITNQLNPFPLEEDPHCSEGYKEQRAKVNHLPLPRPCRQGQHEWMT